MSRPDRRPREHAVGARIGYRIDRFLGLHPAVQLLSVLSAALVLALFFGGAIVALDATVQPAGGCGDQAVCRTGAIQNGLWWAITRMLDGGTVANDTGSGFLRQVFGLGVTIVGLVAVTVLTGAFASSFSERLAAIRHGTLPVFERDHVLLLGWNAHAGVVMRELARSGEAALVVVVADVEREALEEGVREQLQGRAHRLSIIVRRGDPTSAAAIRRASARRAKAVLILPDTESARCADRAALRSLIALERVLGDGHGPRPHVIIEVATQSGRDMVALCDAGEHRGKNVLGAVVVQAYEVNARVVAQAVRQRGAFSVARQILALDDLSFYLHDAGPLAGLTFDQAHAEVTEGILIGLVRDGAPLVSPDGAVEIAASDRVLVFNSRSVAPRVLREPPKRRTRTGSFHPPDPDALLRLLVLRFRTELVPVLAFLDARGPVHATVLVPAADAARAREALARAPLRRTEIELIEGDPLEAAAIDRALAHPADVALLLAPDVPPEQFPEADADQLISLLQMRRKRGERAAAPEHVVVEVHSPETRLPKQLAHGDDFILSREIVGLLLARELHAVAFGGSSVYHDVLAAVGPIVELRPMQRYAGGLDRPSFADLVAGARRQGEVAIGVAAQQRAPRLLPPRDEVFVAEGSRLVVLRPRPAGGEPS